MKILLQSKNTIYNLEIENSRNLLRDLDNFLKKNKIYKANINKLSFYSQDSFLREQILKAIQKGFESVKFFNYLKNNN
ncbi:MAG TPA: hypothetical protein PLA57_01755 [Candidatus Paceibacterota bacterium]|jgi:hypothetical protein|nr:hypothetical protein [Candidatus Paceibacterota bacterium]HRS47991.1 hypothetical protein [Candidatus Paceibacterota bacterium]